MMLLLSTVKSALERPIQTHAFQIHVTNTPSLPITHMIGLQYMHRNCYCYTVP